MDVHHFFVAWFAAGVHRYEEFAFNAAKMAGPNANPVILIINVTRIIVLLSAWSSSSS